MTGETILLVVAAAILVYAASSLLFGRGKDLPITDNWDEGEDEEEQQLPWVTRQLRAVRLDIEPMFFIAAVVLVGVLAFLFFLELFPNALIQAVLVGAAVIMLGFVLLRDLSAWRARRFEIRLVDAIELMQAALQGGENPKQALSTTAEATRGAVRREFAEVVKRLDLGLGIRSATRRMVEVYDSEGTRLFVHALVAKWSAGGDLGILLKSVNRIIRERVKMRIQMSGQLGGVRYGAWVMAGLPYLIVPVFLWVKPDWVATLSSHPLGPTLLLVAIGLQVLGLFWIRSILRTDP